MKPRPIRLLCLLTLLVCIAPRTSAEARDELIAERSLYTKTFANEDGSTTYQLAAEPVHYRSPDRPGEWLDVDTTLEPANGWINQSTNIPVRLPPELGAGEPIAMGPELGIRWTPGPLRALLFSGEEVELAMPQPSPGTLVEGRADAVLYADLYPGIDLQVEVGSGTLLLTTLLKSFAFDVERREIEAFILDAGFETEPHLLQAMEERLAAGPDEGAFPVHFGTAEDEYVITLASRPGGAMLPGDPDPEPGREIAEFLGSGRVEHVFNHEILVDSRRLPEGRTSTTTAALTAVLKFESKADVYVFHPLRIPNPKADVVTLRNGICAQGIVILGPIGATAGFPIEVTLRADSGIASLSSGLTAAEYGVRRDPLPADLPPAAPAVQLCLDHHDFATDFDLAIASFAGLRSLRDKLLPAAGGQPVVNLQLGYKLTAKKPTPLATLFHVFPRRVPPQLLPATKSVSSRTSWDRSDVDSIFDAPEYAFDIDFFTRQNGRLVPVPNPADCGTRIQCETAPVGAWGRYTSDRDGFTFGALTRPAALDDLAAALRAGADFFHVALTPGVYYGSEPVFAELADLRLEITAKDVAVSTAEVQVSDPLGPDGKPDAKIETALYPGETLRFDVDLLKLDNASEVTLTANDLELFRDYGLQVSWQRTVSGPPLFDRATLEKRPSPPPPAFDKDKAVLTVSWTDPGSRIYWADAARRNTAMVRLIASFPGASGPSEAEVFAVRLEELDGQIDLRSAPRVQKVPVNAPVAGPHDLGIQAGSLQGATEMRLRVAQMWVPVARRLDPVPAQYYELSDPGWLSGSDVTGVSFFPAKLAADYGSGTYMFVVEPCFSSSRTRSRYELCREDRRERLVVEIEGDPKIDFVFRSTTQPTGAPKNFQFDVHGSELGDRSVTRVKMSNLSVTAQPTVLNRSTANTLTVQSRLRAVAACGPHYFAVSRFSAATGIWRVASHLVSLHRGADDSVVFEAECGEVDGFFFKDARPGPVASNGEVVTLAQNRTDGFVSWQFRVAAPDPGYRIFVRARTPTGPPPAPPVLDPPGGTGTLEEEDALAAGGWKTLRTFDWTVTDGTAYDVRLLNLAGVDTFALADKKTYRLTLKHRTKHRFPQLDMVVLAPGSIPTNADLCFGP